MTAIDKPKPRSNSGLGRAFDRVCEAVEFCLAAWLWRHASPGCWLLQPPVVVGGLLYAIVDSISLATALAQGVVAGLLSQAGLIVLGLLALVSWLAVHGAVLP